MASVRFNLRTVFVLATVVIAFLGFSQWRRQNISRECRELEAEGVVLSLPSELSDYCWQRVPSSATVSTYYRVRKPYSRNDAVIRRLQDLGVTEIKEHKHMLFF